MKSVYIVWNHVMFCEVTALLFIFYNTYLAIYPQTRPVLFTSSKSLTVYYYNIKCKYAFGFLCWTKEVKDLQIFTDLKIENWHL